MEPNSEVHATTTTSSEWVNDWDLLSPRFQSEAAAYLQVVGVMLVIVLFKKRRATADALSAPNARWRTSPALRGLANLVRRSPPAPAAASEGQE